MTCHIRLGCFSSYPAPPVQRTRKFLDADLPGFVVLNGGLIPPGGLDCFNSGFLPAAFQGSVFKAGESGRTPFAQGSDGRDHNPFGFSLWLAGGGVKGGTIFGATDEYGYKAIENKVEIHDLHATMLYLLGLDHEQLTFRWSGRDMRLTDVYGKLITGILS